MIFIVLGAGLLLVIAIWLGVGMLRGAGPRDRPTSMPTLGPLGLHEGPLWDGATAWRSDPALVDELAAVVLAQLAQRHRVLVLASPQATVPPVFGGPVFRAPSLDAERIGDLYDELEDMAGPPLVLLALGPEAEQALPAIRADLPRDAALLLVSSSADDADQHTVSCRREGPAWVLEGPGGTVNLTTSTEGFVAAPAAG